MKSLTKNALYVFAATLTMEEFVVGGLSVAKLAGIAVLFFALFDIKESFKKTNSRIVALVSLYILFAFISLFWTYNLQGGIQNLFTLIQIYILGIVVFNQLNKEKDILTFFTFFAIGCVIASFDIIHNYYTGNAYRGAEIHEDIAAVRYSAFGVDPNESGMLLVIGLTFLISRFEKANLLKRAILLIASFICVYAIFLTASRTAFFLFLMVFFGYLVQMKFSIKSYISISLAVVLLGWALIYFNLIPLLTFQRIFSVKDQIASGSFSGREVAWQNLTFIFFDNSFLGVGLGGESEALKDYGLRVMSSHNAYLNILTQVGFIGFLPFMIICVKSFKEFYKVRTRHKWLLISYVLLLIGIFTLTYDQKKLIWIFFFIAAVFETQKDIMPTHENNTDS